MQEPGLFGKKVQVKKKGKQLVFGAENRISGARFYSFIPNTDFIILMLFLIEKRVSHLDHPYYVTNLVIIISCFKLSPQS